MGYKLKSISGREIEKSVGQYLINWDGESRSKIQFKVKQFLKPYWKLCVVYEEFPVYGTRLKVDFFNATKKIAIEVQGRQHDEVVEFFHGSKFGLFSSLGRDQEKRKWLELNNIRLLEIYEKEINRKKLSVEFFKENFDLIL